MQFGGELDLKISKEDSLQVRVRTVELISGNLDMAWSS
jgi:hypothetical protein